MDTLEVKLYADQSTESFIRDLVIDEDFAYIEEEYKLRFEEEQVPPSEHFVTATYFPATTCPGDAR